MIKREETENIYHYKHLQTLRTTKKYQKIGTREQELVRIMEIL